MITRYGSILVSHEAEPKFPTYKTSIGHGLPIWGLVFSLFRSFVFVLIFSFSFPCYLVFGSFSCLSILSFHLVCLAILSIYLSIYLSLDRSIYLCTYLSMSVWLSCLSIYLSDVTLVSKMEFHLRGRSHCSFVCDEQIWQFFCLVPIMAQAGASARAWQHLTQHVRQVELTRA